MKSTFSIRIYINQDSYSKIITPDHGTLKIKLSNYTISAKDIEISIEIKE